jgi:hypothetical protein
MRLLLILPFLVTACALQEAPPSTPLPPLTLLPPPALVLAGSCQVNRDLADWLQYATFYAEEYVRLVSAAAAKAPADMYDDVILLGQMRDDFSQVKTPDCAEPAQRLIVAAMTRAVEGFQAVINGDSSSLGSTVADVLAQFDQVALIQAELTARLEAQLREPSSGS